MLATAGQAVSKATSFVVALTPIGVFAIAAVVAGTLSVEELQRLQVYLISYVGVSLLLSLWVLPGLVAALTPVPYRALISRTRDALVTAFMTTSLFAVLPLLTEQAKALVREYAGVDERRRPRPTSSCPPPSTSRTPASCCRSASCCSRAGSRTRGVPLREYPRLAGAGLLSCSATSTRRFRFCWICCGFRPTRSSCS